MKKAIVKLKKHLQPIRQMIASRIDRQKLRSMRYVVCNIDNLLGLSRSQVKEIFYQSPQLDAEWREFKLELEKINPPEYSGGVNVGDQRAIYYLARYLKPNLILEVGTHIGASILVFAAAAKKNEEEGVVTRIHTVDIKDVNDNKNKPWETFGADASPLEKLQKLSMQKYVSFTTSNAKSFLQASNDSYDFIFLDGDHSASAVFQEIPLGLARLNAKGAILLHDYFPQGNPLWAGHRALKGPWIGSQELIRRGARFSIIPLGKLPWPTKLNSNITSLAILTTLSE